MAAASETGREFRCIAIETATARGSVAVASGDAVFVVRLDAARDSSRQLFLAIDEALARGDIDRRSLDCIAFGNGPGSFTGVRVATAAAQALGFALDIPVCPVSTLAAVAVEAGRARGAEPVAVCLDARMGEAYIGVYEFDANGVAVAVVPDQLADPATYRLPALAKPALAAGPGWEVYPELRANNAATLCGAAPDIWPGAAAVAVEARELFRQGRCVAAHAALPNYIRNKVTY